MRAPTSGRKPFDRSIVEGPIARAVWKLAWPTMLQNAIGGAQGFVDHAMVGHYVGYTGNAAIGVSWQIFLVVMVFIGSLFTGMGVLVARFAGAGDTEKVNRAVYQAIITSAVLAVGILAPIGYFLAPALLGLVKATPAVQAEALPYLRIMFVFGFGMMMFFLLSGALRSAGDARTPLRYGIALTMLNVVFNVILIGGLGPIPSFGTAGAAMGTVLAAGLVSLVALYRLFVSHRWVLHFHPGMSLRPDWEVIRMLFRFGIPAGIQGVAMNVGGVLLLRFIGSLELSGQAQAAFAVGYAELFSVITWTSAGLMGAAAAVAGQNLGAERPDRSARGVYVASIVGLGVAVIAGTAFLTIPRTLIGIFGIQDADTLAIGSGLLRYLSVSGLFVTVALAYTGGLQGTGDTRGPLYISIVSQLILPLGMCAAIQRIRPLEPGDIWTAIVLGHVTRSVLSVARFRQGRWRNIVVSVQPAP